MTASTTLMTFLVRTPPTTRSVNLLGSWDNFSKVYSMQRDSRRGREHWTGCHSFENIICDGNVSTVGGARDGGLKMGGTYWYYYQLDDAVDFHNAMEPATTSCPLLPGQLVNVLNVPFHLSSGRSRNDSVSSTSSELRTMNPEDKFLNPRPVPVPPPKLPRLNTSPTLPSFPSLSENSSRSGSPWSARSLSSSRGESPPASAATLRMFRVPRKSSTDAPSRSISPHNKTTGIRAAFRQLTSQRSASPDSDTNRGRTGPADREMEISEPILLPQTRSEQTRKPASNTSSRSISRENSPMSRVEGLPVLAQLPQLALRRGLDQPADLQTEVSAASFQTHQRQRSRSKEPSSLRNSLTLPDDLDSSKALVGPDGQRYQPMEALQEAPSQQNTPKWPTTARRVGEVDMNLPNTVPVLEKRLPTLPNTPSSVYPLSAACDSPAKRLSEELRNLHSHFSEMTVSSAASPSAVRGDHSHFSQWTTASPQYSPASVYATEIVSTGYNKSSPHHQPSSPYEILTPCFVPSDNTLSREDSVLPYSEILPSTISCSTISSCAPTCPPSPLYYHADIGLSGDHALCADKPHGVGSCPLPEYSLPHPLQDCESKAQLNDQTNRKDDTIPHTSRIGIRRPDSVGDVAKHESFSHSTSMQQLMDELSYLGNMISK